MFNGWVIRFIIRVIRVYLGNFIGVIRDVHTCERWGTEPSGCSNCHSARVRPLPSLSTEPTMNLPEKWGGEREKGMEREDGGLRERWGARRHRHPLG